MKIHNFNTNFLIVFSSKLQKKSRKISDSYCDEFELTSHPIGANSNGSFDDVLELVSEGERKIVNRGFQMDQVNIFIYFQ